MVSTPRTPLPISCWAQLAESFRSNLLTSRIQRKNSLALFHIVQGPKESLKSYYARFNSEKLLIDHLDPGVTFAAMARGVRPGTPLRFSLNKRPPENMADLLDRVEKYLRAEEDSTTSQYEETHTGQKRQVNLTQGPAKRTKASTSLALEFDDADLDGVSLPHDDALVITLRIDTFQVKCILVDTGSSVDIIFKDAFNQMEISGDRVKPIASSLYGFTGASAPVKGIIPLTVVVGEAPRQAVHTLDFLIVRVKSSYNGILGRTGLNKLQAVASTYHLIMKFPTSTGVGLVKGDQILARRCYVASCKTEETLSIDDHRDEKTLRRAEPSAVSAVLIREQDGRQLPIYYVSEVLQGAEQRYPNTEKLALALLIAARKLRPYFQSHTIIVLTDKPLRRILYRPDLSGHLWAEAEALATITENKCEDFFWRAIICRFGIPRVLVTDNEKQFDNPTFRTFCTNLAIEQRFTSVAHPQTNGQTEVTNRTLLQGIKKKLDGAKGLWVEELPKIFWAYNTTTRTPTGETSFSLSFGTEALIPVEVGLPSLRLTAYDLIQNEEALRANLDLLEERREQAAMRLVAYQHRVSKFYDQRVRPCTFLIGDLVLRRIEASAQREAIGKLAPNWECPYIIVKKGGPGAYHLEHMDGKSIPRTWNATNL
ncbi:hypothetical protein RJ639_011515 [Escallonia herrerae]|uniref:Integrase catalytic domain-containing protein n=1 Tax=Escallonia herrerae TaxID=1293975 RepID=A0AA89AT06_9ASTE|nr:hypothetical protein RJ639_011515 [Escallonia herrerae]